MENNIMQIEYTEEQKSLFELVQPKIKKTPNIPKPIIISSPIGNSFFYDLWVESTKNQKTNG